jgi:hypothetical protein
LDRTTKRVGFITAETDGWRLVSRARTISVIGQMENIYIAAMSSSDS